MMTSIAIKYSFDLGTYVLIWRAISVTWNVVRNHEKAHRASRLPESHVCAPKLIHSPPPLCLLKDDSVQEALTWESGPLCSSLGPLLVSGSTSLGFGFSLL